MGNLVEGERNQKHKQIHGSCQRAEKSVEYESDCDTNCKWSTWRNMRSKKEGSQSR